MGSDSLLLIYLRVMLPPLPSRSFFLQKLRLLLFDWLVILPLIFDWFLCDSRTLPIGQIILLKCLHISWTFWLNFLMKSLAKA